MWEHLGFIQTEVGGQSQELLMYRPRNNRLYCSMPLLESQPHNPHIARTLVENLQEIGLSQHSRVANSSHRTRLFFQLLGHVNSGLLGSNCSHSICNVRWLHSVYHSSFTFFLTNTRYASVAKRNPLEPSYGQATIFGPHFWHFVDHISQLLTLRLDQI